MTEFRFHRLERYRTGGSRDHMELKVPLPRTPDGKANQHCPDPACRPALFQLGDPPSERPATDPTRIRRPAGPGETICPYCGWKAPDGEFVTPEDIEAAKKEIFWSAERDVGDFLKDMARDFNRRAPRGGLISVRMDVKQNSWPRPIVWREDLLRDLVCQLCGRRYGVYAIALFCPDCGGPNLATHFRREVELVTKQTELAEQVRDSGNRELAYRLLGNAHEDVLTAFETYLKTVHRFLSRLRSGATEEVKKDALRNRFQNVERARRAFNELGFDPFNALTDGDLSFLRLNIEKRHVVGHNLGIADESYAAATDEEQPGRTVRLLAEEIQRFADICGRVVLRLDAELQPGRVWRERPNGPDQESAE